MGIHVAGTQHGLSYKLTPLEGKRAPVLKALMSRAPAANIQFQSLQSLIWQIEGGLSYERMPRQSQLLVDQLIPEFRNQLNDDFVVTLQQRINELKQIQVMAGLANNMQVVLSDYERIQQTIQQNANNFENLSRQFVNVIPGTSSTAGPSSWSKLNSRVYARLTGGNVYGQVGNLEIRVVPSRSAGSASLTNDDHLQSVYYRIGSAPSQSTANDLADVPVEAVIAYPNNVPGMQGLMIDPINKGNYTPGSTKIWVAQAQPSSDGKNAGMVILKWDMPSASDCTLSVQPTLNTLQVPVPVSCTNTQAGWPTLLPNPIQPLPGTAPAPVQYLFKLAGTVGSGPVSPSPSVLVYALPYMSYGQGTTTFDSLIRYPTLPPCATEFPAWNCWWPFGFSDATCQSSAASCASYSAKIAGDAADGMLVFGLSGSAQVQDSLVAKYDGSNFSLPKGYAEHLAVNPQVSYFAEGGCFATLGGVDMEFQITMTDNISPVANAIAYPSPSQQIRCVGDALPDPISKVLNGEIGVSQFLTGFPQLNNDLSALETAFASQDVLTQLQVLDNLLSDVGALGAKAPTDLRYVPWTSIPPNLWSQSPTVAAGCVYQFTITPTIASKIFGAGLVGGQLLKTHSTLSVSGIAVPGDGSESACYLPAVAQDGASSPPTVALMSLGQGAAGATVTITGTGFTNVTGVSFGSTPAKFIVISETSIAVTIPDIFNADAAIRALGPGTTVGIKVTVTTTTGSASALAPFNYAGPK